MLAVYTFGDSILDCGRYNVHGIHPAGLLVRNDGLLFPEFVGRDLQSRRAVQLEHRAVDGATVAGLVSQARGLTAGFKAQPSLALLTVGGNDLIRGLAADTGTGMREFERSLSTFLESLPIWPVYIGTVYDPTFGDDSRNFLGVAPALARANLGRINAILRELGSRYGRAVDIHAHFLGGNASWFTNTIEPSLIGASEVRRVFLEAMPE